MDTILDRFFEISHDLLCIVAADSRLQRVNPAWQRKLGHSTESLTTTPYLPLFHPDDRNAVREHLDSLLHGKPLSMLEARLRRSDGTYLCFLWSATHIPEHGVLFAIGKDITARKQVEGALAESELKFRSVTESAMDAIVTADEAGIIDSWNLGAQRIFGYSAEQVIGRPLVVLMPERYRAAHLAGHARFIDGGAPRAIGRTLDLHGLRSDGSEFPIELSLSTWRGANGLHFSGIIRDSSKNQR